MTPLKCGFAKLKKQDRKIIRINGVLDVLFKEYKEATSLQVRERTSTQVQIDFEIAQEWFGKLNKKIQKRDWYRRVLLEKNNFTG